MYSLLFVYVLMDIFVDLLVLCVLCAIIKICYLDILNIINFLMLLYTISATSMGLIVAICNVKLE